MGLPLHRFPWCAVCSLSSQTPGKAALDRRELIMAEHADATPTNSIRQGGLLTHSHKLPAWLKVLYSLFLCVLVPAYWSYYGPANFLWFSDIALLVTLVALWLESRFLASMQAVAVVPLELLWVVDFSLGLVGGVHPIGISTYMFDSEIPLFL